ncbi:hypothetical protein [Blattabacterium cuenoti]|uniref:hypothetical protein n=1 Tax=Blattabacterium cuenoti TaxID=1653831 RepID=UPI00311D2F2A
MHLIIFFCELESVNAVLKFIKCGNEIVTVYDIYVGTFRLIGIDTKFVDTKYIEKKTIFLISE